MIARQEAASLGRAKMKGKRTKRPRPSSPVIGLATDEGDDSSVESAGPTTKSTEEEEDMAHCLILLARGLKPENNNNNETSISYECKTCNKSFPSFQALGGHRASHKKPKLVPDPEHLPTKSPILFSLHQYNEEEIGLSLQIATKNNHHHTTNNSNNKTINKVHECSLCGAEFSSGQALGGHMRRHRPIGGVPTSLSQNMPITNHTPKIHIQKIHQQKTKSFLSLDLNLPAPDDDNNHDHDHHQHQHHRDSSYIFSSKEKTLVFSSASSLVDCHHESRLLIAVPP